eukprot:5510006-Alexandrium_andersonii.AAC.1
MHSRPSTSEDSAARPHHARLIYARITDGRAIEVDKSVDWNSATTTPSALSDDRVRNYLENAIGGAHSPTDPGLQGNGGRPGAADAGIPADAVARG